MAEDIDAYGETYWHRQHQLSEMLYCVKHEVRLVDSPVLLKSTKYNPHLSELTNGVVESKVDWCKRRVIAAYYSKPIESRPYSASEICRAASIDWITFNRRQELFEEIVSNLNLYNRTNDK